MSGITDSERPDGTVDTQKLLGETVTHMRQQNEHQLNQLIKLDEVVRQLNRATLRTNLLLLSAVLLLTLGGVQQAQIYEFQQDLRQARDRYTALEQSVEQKLSSSSATVAQKVDALEKSAPRVIANEHGDLSLSVQVAPAPSPAVPVAPVPTVRSIHRAPRAAPPAPSAGAFVLVPLKPVESP